MPRPVRSLSATLGAPLSSPLFAPTQLGPLPLTNPIVMAPMTRSRAVEDNAPNALVAAYYAQRTTAGLLVTEGTSPSPNGLGYARIPGIYSDAQVAGWRLVADAVHARGGHIFVQLMHCGRIGHALNLPPGAAIVAPSAIAAAGTMWTDSQGMQPHPVPRAMTEADLASTRAEFVAAARNARAAGIDGVELHAANGYLLEQFLNPHSNQRTDGYGGSIAGRIRFVVEVAQAVADAIGGDRVGIRLSPHGVFNDMPPYDEVEATYTALVTALAPTGIQYVHLVNHASMGSPGLPEATRDLIRTLWPRTLILSGGYDRARAEADLAAGRGDLVAFGRPFIANPDLVRRLHEELPLAAPDFGTFYTPGAKGYTDYPPAG